MGIGAGPPFKDQRGQPLGRGRLGQRARWAEEAALDAAWTGDAPFRRLAAWPDPMMRLLADNEPFTLRCGPARATERLAWLASPGFDVMLSLRAPGAAGPFESDATLERRRQVRSLLPAGPRTPATSPAPAGQAGGAA